MLDDVHCKSLKIIANFLLVNIISLKMFNESLKGKIIDSDFTF